MNGYHNLKAGEYDRLGYTEEDLPTKSHTGKITSMRNGDWGYFCNDPDYLIKHEKGGYQGENILKISEGSYWGFPAGAKSEREWKKVLIDAYNEGGGRQIRKVPGFDGSITFIDVPRIGMDVFDLRTSGSTVP